jgi:hypothetical protein
VVLYVDLDSLPAATLRHLAALRERREHERDEARYTDYQAMAEELALMLCAGQRPTVGWYRRHLRSSEPSSHLAKSNGAPLGDECPPAPPRPSGPR